MTESEKDEIDSLTKLRPAIFVAGQSCFAIAMVVNQLLKRPILPCSRGQGLCSDKWRNTRFRYHHLEHPRCVLTLPNNFELVDVEPGNAIFETIHSTDLIISGNDEARNTATLDVKVRNSLLMYCDLFTFSFLSNKQSVADNFQKYTQNFVPIIIYALAGKLLQPSEIPVLKELRKVLGQEPPIFFVSVPLLPDLVIMEHSLSQDSGCLSDASLSCSSEHVNFWHSSSDNDMNTPQSVPSSVTLFQQLIDSGLLSLMPRLPESYQMESDFVDNFESFPKTFTSFARQVLQCHLTRTVSLLNIIQRRCLQMFITMAFDMSRYLQITPRRMEFVREKEAELYAALSDIAVSKQNEMYKIIIEIKDALLPVLLQKAEDYVFLAVDLPSNFRVSNSKQLHICVRELQDLVLGNLSVAIESKLQNSINVLHDSYTGVLQRCLEHLEDTDGSEIGSTSQALKEILGAAYQVEVTMKGGTSWKTQLINKMKQVFGSVLLKSSEKVDADWRKAVVTAMVNSLSEQKLVRSICAQIKERLSVAHSTFNASLKRLEEQHADRQERTEEQQLKIRKMFTPRIARLTLESTSLKDCILYGMPNFTREIGRGQYGVVYECNSWASYGPCAIKIVLPPDDKHWYDLAMEFCYTKNLPEHDRIVSLRGSVIDTAFGSNRCETAVYLIMDRYLRDLYVAIKCGLDFVGRLRVALDVVDGIRFLHGQGLVHRDVKLKNVLLDDNNRGKITDLGFCKPEAMISGSIVGTPIHMAPELFSGNGKYDNSVDMYAFGILFWYVCAGSVKLPNNYEKCNNKEMLWNDVKRGVRPERLPKFDSDCWQIMEQCWSVEPEKRPWPGDVEPLLQNILTRYQEKQERSRNRRGLDNDVLPSDAERSSFAVSQNPYVD